MSEDERAQELTVGSKEGGPPMSEGEEEGERAQELAMGSREGGAEISEGEEEDESEREEANMDSRGPPISDQEDGRPQESLTMESLASRLRDKYPQLSVHPSECPQDGTPFVYLWRLSKSNTELNKYLPSFHAVVTSAEDEMNVSLFTYHGKLVACVNVSVIDDANITLLDQLARGDILVCQGVTDVKGNEMRGGGGHLYESFGQNRVVARSRSCQFAVFAQSGESSDRKRRCFNCQTLATREERSFMKEEPENNGAAAAVECQVTYA